MAACEATTEAVWLKRFLQDLDHGTDQLVIISEDNHGCIKLSKNAEAHQRTKHMDIRYHYVREQVNLGIVKLEPCPSEQMEADILTKPVSGQKLLKIRDKLGMKRLTLSGSVE